MRTAVHIVCDVPSPGAASLSSGHSVLNSKGKSSQKGQHATYLVRLTSVDAEREGREREMRNEALLSQKHRYIYLILSETEQKAPHFSALRAGTLQTSCEKAPHFRRYAPGETHKQLFLHRYAAKALR